MTIYLDGIGRAELETNDEKLSAILDQITIRVAKFVNEDTI